MLGIPQDSKHKVDRCHSRLAQVEFVPDVFVGGGCAAGLKLVGWLASLPSERAGRILEWRVSTL